MAGKAEKKDKDEAQVKRFREKAKEIGADESADSFDRAFKKVVKPPKASD
jgi:hypothetical protein